MDFVKYRAYDFIEGEMAYDLKDHGIYLREDGKIIQIRRDKDNKLFEHHCTDLALNLCTNKNDIKGTLIYEDDIVKFPSGKKIFIGRVYWNKNKSGFEIKVLLGLGADDKDKAKTYSLQGKKMEIMGNMHEHEDLLQQMIESQGDEQEGEESKTSS